MSHTYILTRPKGKNSVLAQRLAKHCESSQIIELPALALSPLTIDPVGVQFAVSTLTEHDLVFFVSSYAARCFFSYLHQHQISFPDFCHVGVVGHNTAQYLQAECGISPEKIVVPDNQGQADSEAFYSLLERRFFISKTYSTLKKVWIIKGHGGRDWLSTQLQGAGLTVESLDVYCRQPCLWTEQQIHDLKAAMNNTRVYWLITSQEGVLAIFSQLKQYQLLGAISKHRFLVIHPRIAERLQKEYAPYSFDHKPLTIDVCLANDDAILLDLLAQAHI